MLGPLYGPPKGCPVSRGRTLGAFGFAGALILGLFPGVGVGVGLPPPVTGEPNIFGNMVKFAKLLGLRQMGL